MAGHTTPCSASPRLTAYHASALERTWTASPAAGRICHLSRLPEQQTGAELWLNFSKSGWRSASAGVTLRAPEGAERSALSRFEYDDGSIEFVEPLTGIARHPIAPVGCRQGDLAARWKNPALFRKLFDSTYIVPSSACGVPPAAPRVGCYRKARFYDLGCTTYAGHRGEAFRNLEAQATGKLVGGPSIPLFSEWYRRRCLPFDAIYAWDASKDPHQEPTAWYRDVPNALKSKIHYFNVPIALANTTATRSSGPHPLADEPLWRRRARVGDFFGTLLATASPEDFVVVKLDIEGQSGSPEVAIAEAIAARPELLRLVDEFYFEYHFYFDGKDFGWGKIPDPKKSGGPNVDSALGLMSRLRAAGVRAHFWV